MNPPDYIGAIEHARERLIAELLPILHYHNVYHSFGEVIPAAMLLAHQIGVDDGDLHLLKVAAAYHDIGWIIQGENHEIIGVDICRQSLPNFGFSEKGVNLISGMIMATRLPQTPDNVLEEILADADMFTLGSDDYWPRNADLRSEKEALGDAVSDKEWYQNQLDFLQLHQYHTAAAENERGSRKEIHIVELRKSVAKGG